MGGYADAKVRLRGLCLKRRAWGSNHAQIRWNFDQSACKSRQAPTPKRLKRRGLGEYADAKSPAGDCASGLGLVHANHVLIQYNFARVTDIATVLKSLLDSLIPRQFLDLLEHMTGPYLLKFRKEGVWEDTRMLSRLQGTVPHG